MIKIFIKFFLYLLLIIFLSIGYLSFFGFETNKFNNQIKKEILEIDQNLRLELKTVQVLLDPFNFKINIKTLGSSIIYKKNKIDLESVNTKVSINSFLKNNFSLEDLEISTKAIRINNLLSLISSLNNTIELFLLKKVVKDGYIVGDLKVNFDKNGKIQDDYQINGYIKRGKVNFFKTRLDDLNLIFKVKKHKYEFEDINTKFNDILISSSKIVVQEKNNLYNVNGKLSSNEKDINIEFIESIINNDLKNLNNLRLSSENSFSFDISENKKIQNLEINSKINLIKLDYSTQSPFGLCLLLLLY